MTSIALYNLKGGVGKTASAVNLAYLAAADGYKTLLWDVDQQGSSSYYYKVKPKQYSSIKNVLQKDADLSSTICTTDFELLDILPADNTVKSADAIHHEMQQSKNGIKQVLKALQKEYEFIIIDCPPGFSLLTQNVWNAVDIVLMPTISTTLSLRTYTMVKEYAKETGLDLKKLMCFFTMVDLRKTLHNEVLGDLLKDKNFFNNYIPYLSDVEKMGIHKAPIMEYANSSYAAQCYRNLWAEIKEGVL